MPYVSGTFSRIYSWQTQAAAGIGIDPSQFDQDGTDVAGALSTCILRDGTGKPTADIPWNGKGITGLRTAVAAGEAVTFDQMNTAIATGPGGVIPFNFCLGVIGL